MVAVTTGEYQYAGYNPAMPSYQDGYRATVSYSVLNLDRSLNFVSIGGPLVNAVIDTTVPLEQRKPKGSTLRVQLGWLRAGVSNIDARDNEGDKIGSLSSSENEFLGAAAVRISPKFGLGFSARFYYASLPYPNPSFPKITSSGFGLDIGALYQLRDNITLGLAIQHIAAKYHWDSGTLYGQTGASTTDYFPIVFRVGGTIRPIDPLLIALDISLAQRLYDTEDNLGTHASSSSLALGAEYELADGLFIRAGMKGLDLINKLSQEISESAGFGYSFKLEGILPSVSYALISDRVTGGLTQMISVGVRF
jgi:opacity protein-like surface antigen